MIVGHTEFLKGLCLSGVIGGRTKRQGLYLFVVIVGFTQHTKGYALSLLGGHATPSGLQTFVVIGGRSKHKGCTFQL